MWLSLLGVVYVASAALIGYVLYQDRTSAARTPPARRGADVRRDPRASSSPEMVFSTHA